MAPVSNGSVLIETIGVGGAVMAAIIGVVAKRLPQSKVEQQQRVDKMTSETLTRLDAANIRYETRVTALENQHEADEVKHNDNRNRIYVLEQQVRSLTAELAVAESTVARLTKQILSVNADLAAAESIAARLRRGPTDRTRQDDDITSD